MDKYAYLIELGSGLEGMDEAHKTEENLIKGCQSRVWFHADMQDGLLYFTADSDAIITKGIAGLLIRVFSGQKPADIAKADLHFIDEIGLTQHLSPTRSNSGEYLGIGVDIRYRISKAFRSDHSHDPHGSRMPDRR